MAEAFVYCWTDKVTNKLYIGAHKGSEDDGYVCSSKYLMNEYKQRPNDFSRQIIAKGTFKDMFVFESKILQSLNASKDPMMYNRQNNDRKHYNYKGHSEDTKNKIGQANNKPQKNPSGPRPHVNQKGENNNSFRGWYITPWGRYGSASLAAAANKDHELSNYQIYAFCVYRNNSKIQKITSSNFIKKEWIGKTWSELGFGFELKGN